MNKDKFSNIMEYEDMSGNKVIDKSVPKRRSQPVQKQTFASNTKSRFLATNKALLNDFKNLKNKMKRSKKPNKKLTKIQQSEENRKRKDAILGIGQLFVVVSIIYSTAVIYPAVDSIESKIMLVPQAIFAFFTLLKAFSKLYK